MSYLIQKDYLKQIQVDNLNQIIGSDPTILSSAELAAMEEITSYLTQKYDLASEFQDLDTYNPANVYKSANRVYLDAPAYSSSATYALNNLCLQAGNVYICTTAITVGEPFNASHWTLLGAQYSIFFAVFPQPLFDYKNVYPKGSQVFWKDSIYTAQQATNILSQNSQIQFSSIQALPVQNVFPDDPVNGSAFWGTGTAYSVPAFTSLSDTTYWTAGDNRSQQMVMTMVDIALYHVHSRISPRNIPDLRVKRYDEARSWLKSAGKGDITANLPVKQIATGGRIRFGGNVKIINRY